MKLNKIKLITLISIIFAGILLSTTVSPYDWLMWRNDSGNAGESIEEIILPLTLAWHSNAPSVEENGVVVSNGIAYMQTYDGYLYAFNVSTGLVVSGFPVTIGSSYGTPAVDSVSGHIYALTGNNNLYAINFNGSIAWTVSIGSVGGNYFKGPIIENDFIYFKAGGNVYKYNSTGDLQWSTATIGYQTQPSLMGDYVYVNTESGQIRKYNKNTGSEITTGGFPISTGSSYAGITTIKDKIFHKSDVLYVYNANDGSLIWSQPCGGSTMYKSPAVSNGVVYIYGWDSKVYAFNENTGATITGFPSVALNPDGVSGRNYGSPTIAGDKVFIGAGTTQIMKILGAAESSNPGEVIDEYYTYSEDTQGFDLCSPVISDGVVFVMLDGGGLYAFFDSETQWEGGGITINNGDECTENQEVTLTMDPGENTEVSEMRISENPLFTGIEWESYMETKQFMLSAGYGTKTVYVQFKDSQGQLSNVFNDQIDYLEYCGDNTAPVANDDYYSTDENTVLNVNAASGVLDNDTDADTDPLTAILVGDVSHGSLTLNSDGSFVYTPDVDFYGTDSFTYKANDGEADSNTATVTIQIKQEAISEVIFEIMPRPFNRKSKGVLPAAILGSSEINVSRINPETLKITRMGQTYYSPIRWSYEDIGSPTNDDECECKNHNETLDGYIDMTLKFERQEIKTLLSDDDVGTTVTLMISGNFKEEFGGNEFEAYDCIDVLK